jgi:uncharacterized damage-inducible protein DinB
MRSAGWGTEGRTGADRQGAGGLASGASATVIAMPSPLLADAFGHHVWATIRVLDACAALDDAQLATAVPGTYGSIIDTLRHVVDGDVFYLDVLRGGAPEPFDKERSDIPALRAVMDGHDEAWQALVAGDLDPTTDVVEYEDNGYETHAPLGIRLAQALYHGTDHRSQVCTALTSLGIEPPSIETWDYAALDGRMYTVKSTESAAAAGAPGSTTAR